LAPSASVNVQWLLGLQQTGSFQFFVNVEALTENGANRIDAANRTGGGDEDPFSRNFNWSLPLVHLAGRAELNLGLSLAYNSLVWTKTGSFISFDDDQGFPSPGFRLGFPVIQPYYNVQLGKNGYLFLASDGTRSELRQVGTSNLYQAVDSSYLLLDNGTMKLKTADGTQISYVWQGSDFQCTEIKDRNGNYITINYTSFGRVDTIVDTLNRTIKFNYDASEALTSITQSWTVNGSSVTHTWASFQYRNPNLTINTNFSGLTNVGPQNGSTLKVLSRVTLADNSRFEFDYTSWGQVWKISRFASDGQTLLNYRSYNLPLDHTSPQPDCPKFTQRRDWAKYWNMNQSGVEQEAITSFIQPISTSWTMPDGTPQSGTLSQVTVPDGTYHKIFSHSTGWDKGLPLLTETYEGQTRQRQLTTAWTQDDTALPVPLNPRITETNTYDPATNRKRTRKTYQQLTFPDGTSCFLPQDVLEYQANATDVLRSTRTGYNADSAYTTRRIIGLVSERAVYEGDVAGGTLVSRFTYHYDEVGSIQGSDAPVQHDNTNYTANFVIGRANLSSVKRFDVNNISTFTATSSKYNTAGSVVSVKDASTHETTVSYTDAFAANGTTLDPAKPFVTLAYPTTVNDADTFSAKARYNYDFGAVTWRQTPQPNVTINTLGPERTFTYDSLGRLERTTSLVNSARERYVYGPNYMESWSTVNNVADELHSVQVFDGAGRAIATAKNHPGSSGGFSGQITIYDAMGRAAKQSNPTETSIGIQPPALVNPYGWPASGDDSTWRYTEQTYDWKGRPLVTTNQDGTTRPASYSGCGCAGGEVVTLTDEGSIDAGVAKRRQQKIYSDVLGRTVKTEIVSWEGGSVYSATVHTYNARDQVKLIRRFAGAAPADVSDLSCPSGTCQKTEMTYDGYGRLKTKHTPAQQTDPNNPASTDHVTWEYNGDDTIQQVTDPRGTVATYTHNNRHLVTGVSYSLLSGVPTTGPSGVAASASVTFSYDAAGNRKTMTDGMGHVNYNYDQLSRLTSELRHFSNLSGSSTGGNYTLTYTYNLGNELTSVTDPNGAQVSYNFDAAGRLSSVSGTPFSVSTFVSNIQYRAWGAPKSVLHGNGRTAASTYDARMRISSYQLTIVPQDSLKLRNEYEYYADGRLKKMTDLDDHEPTIIGAPDTARHFSRIYDFDHAGRLSRAKGIKPSGVEEDRPFTQSYSYDAFDNLTQRSGKYYYQQPATSDSAPFTNNRRLGSDYAADGQEIRSTSNGMVRDWTYDAAGKMVQVKETVTSTSQVSTYVTSYDGNGRQVRDFLQENATNTNTYMVRSTVLGGRVITRLNNAGTKVSTVIDIDSRVTPARIGSGASGGVGWTHIDPLGLSEGGDTKAVYDPLGNRVAWQPVPTGPSPLTYPRSSASFGGVGSAFGSAQDRDCVLNDRPISCQELNRQVWLGVVNVVGRIGVHPVEAPYLPLGIAIAVWVEDDSKKLAAAQDDEENDIIRVNKDEDGRGHYALYFIPQKDVMVSITPGQFKDQVQKTLSYSDCKDFIAKLISKAAELSEGKNDAVSTDVMKLFDMINSQTKGGGFRLNVSFKDIPSYLPPVSGGSGLAFGNVPYGNGVAMVFQRGYYSDRAQGQVERIMANYGLTGVHEIIHLAGTRTPYLEGLLDQAAKAVDPDSTSFDNGLVKHCLPPNLR
jgi:YD repeat-containing protein